MNELLTVQLKTWYYEMKAGTRDLVYYAPKPSFLDWLFGRQKKVVFQADVRELLLDAEKGTERIVDISLKDE